MDYGRRWTEMQNYPSIIPQLSSQSDTYNHHHVSAYSSSQIPNSELAGGTTIPPPRVDPYIPVSSYSLANGSGFGREAHQHQHQQGLAYSCLHAIDADAAATSSVCYEDPNWMQNWAVKEAIRLHGGVTVPSIGTEKLVLASPNSTFWTSTTSQPHRSNSWKKAPKKTKVVQSAWCEICKVDCNSKGVLEQHKLGKRHKKNLEKLKGETKSAPAPGSASIPISAASVVLQNPVIGPQENPELTKSVTAPAQKSRKKPAEPVEDLESKRKKVLEGGAAADAVRTCALCNVVCNSEIVFKYHLAGQKHAAMIRKHASETALAAAT